MTISQSFGVTKPMECFFGGSSGAIRDRMASNTCCSCARVFWASESCLSASISVLRSRLDSLAASSRWVASTSRNCTKARTTYSETSTAREVFRTVAAISAPCSVKASGSLRRPPRPVFDVAIFDIQSAYSAALIWNMKSSGNRSALRRTCSLSRRVSTPYSAASSLSMITFWPRTSWIRREMESASSGDFCWVFEETMICQLRPTRWRNNSTEATIS